VSFAAHAAVFATLFFVVRRQTIVAPPAPERMIYVEPAPPPPPLGVPAPAAPEPERLPAPTEPVQKRLVEPSKPKRRTPPSTIVQAPPRGETQGEVGGVVGGQVGGEAGGKPGGVVGGQGDAPIAAEQVAHPPVAVSRTIPVYPPLARMRGLEGQVVLRVVVDRDGHVEEAVTVVRSTPPFDTAAVDAVRRWRFEPGRDEGGRQVRVLLEVPIRFQLR